MISFVIFKSPNFTKHRTRADHTLRMKKLKVYFLELQISYNQNLRCLVTTLLKNTLTHPAFGCDPLVQEQKTSSRDIQYSGNEVTGTESSGTKN